MPTRSSRTRYRAYGVEDDAGGVLRPERPVGRQVVREVAQELADARGQSTVLYEVGEDSDGVKIVVDREEVRPRAYVTRGGDPDRGRIDQDVAAIRAGSTRAASRGGDAGLIRDLYEAYSVDGADAAGSASLSTELLDASVRSISPERYDTGVASYGLAKLRGPTARSSGTWLVQLRRSRWYPVYSLARLERRVHG